MMALSDQERNALLVYLNNSLCGTCLPLMFCPTYEVEDSEISVYESLVCLPAISMMAGGALTLVLLEKMGGSTRYQGAPNQEQRTQDRKYSSSKNQVSPSMPFLPELTRVK
ncbi:hypothetical protein KI387_015244, partial [Taxus chinensis]